MYPSFLMSDAQVRAAEERQRRAVERRVPLAVPWDGEIPWRSELQFQAKTYKPRSLFNVPATKAHDVNRAKPRELIVSPGGEFCYSEVTLPRGEMLATADGRRRGTVLFDGPVRIPRLSQRERFSGDPTRTWDKNPWMSLTPMELLSLRPGTRRAKGRVVVAGLGLGHQLIEVSKRKQVTHLLLVERSRELVDWILPRVRPHLGCPVEVLIGDAYEVLPTLSADVALVDVFPSWGGNRHERDRLREECPRIGHVWAWGAADLRD